MRVSMKENPPTVRCKKSGSVKLYTVSTAINMSFLEDFLTSFAEALAHPPTSTLNKEILC